MKIPIQRSTGQELPASYPYFSLVEICSSVQALESIEEMTLSFLSQLVNANNPKDNINSSDDEKENINISKAKPRITLKLVDRTKR